MANNSSKSMTSRQFGNAISMGGNARRGSAGLGSMMGFMGLPCMSRGDAMGSYAGPWNTVDPWAKYRAQNAANNQPPTTGGEDPGLDPNGDGSGDAGNAYWKFPQYSQTWAFTPPAPTPYQYPQPFDPSKYGNPFAKK